MDNAVWGMLNDAEKELLRRVDPAGLQRLGEDELVELHGRIRRARGKYAKLYRRRASRQVDADASRSRAHAAHARTSVKAEAFEEALATVSLELARAAKDSAAAIASERRVAPAR